MRPNHRADFGGAVMAVWHGDAVMPIANHTIAVWTASECRCGEGGNGEGNESAHERAPGVCCVGRKLTARLAVAIHNCGTIEAP